MPNVTIAHPKDEAQLPPFQAFLVTGQATDASLPEHHTIDTVTVQVDGGPVIDAVLTTIKNKTASIVDYAAAVEVVSGTDPHTVTVVAINDNQMSATKRIQVFTGPVFQAAAPSVLVELLSPQPFDVAGPSITRLVTGIQRALLPAADQLAGIGKVLAGPNLVAEDGPSGLSRLRVGVWIEDAGFPVLPAQPPAFPLPRLNAPGAAAGFALADRLPVPLSLGLSFATSVPTATLQSLVDAVFPQVKEAADGTFDTLHAIHVSTIPPDTVVTTVAADVVDLPVDAALIERLGAPLDPDLGQHLPAVVGHDSTVDVGDVPHWLLVTLVPSLGAALLAVTGVAGVVASRASDQIHGVVSGLLFGLPTRLPVRNTDLGVALKFPTLVPDWPSFGTTADGILATATVSLHDRDQSEVTMAVHGSDRLECFQSEAAGGTGHRYLIDLSNLAPDPGRFRWQVTGFASEEGAVEANAFGLGGAADVIFPLPLFVTPGTYAFVLTVDAVETCGSDPTKLLSATLSRAVAVHVKEDPVHPF